LRQRHAFERGFPLIRSLRASAQRSTSVLFSFVLSLLIVAGSFAIRQSKTILARIVGHKIGELLRILADRLEFGHHRSDIAVSQFHVMIMPAAVNGEICKLWRLHDSNLDAVT
jgi:hypothetical protein